jgi:hypothetical protein
MSLRLRRAAAVLVLPIALLVADPLEAQEPPPPELDEGQGVAVTSAEEGDKAPTSRLAESDPELVSRMDATRVSVLIKLDYDSAATYGGGVPGLAPTSPSVTGEALSEADPAVQAHDAYAAEQEAAAIAAIQAVVPQARFGTSLRIVYGGIAATVPANRIKDIVQVDGVVAVQADEIQQVLTDSSPEFIGAPTIYNQVGGAANGGVGTIYGNIDTGIWPEHPSFADQGNLGAPPPRADGTARTCQYGDNPLTPANDPFVCQNKLIGGEAFLDTYHAVLDDEIYDGTARDEVGHGTHTTSTSAGNLLNSAPIFGVERGPLGGIAPGAWVIEYRACGPQGCFPSDSTLAVQEAILDGVDVINFSVAGGTSPYTDPVELAFLDAYAAGVFVTASAGNEGPGAGTANHLSPWTMSVGASTQERAFTSQLSLTADNGDTLQLEGASITAGISSPLPVVLSSAAPYSNPLCLDPAPPGLFTGQIVACQRGPGRIAKGFNVLQGGAAGMILYNPDPAEVLTDNHFLPTVHLPDDTAFLAFMSGHTGVTATFTQGAADTAQGDVMTNFSSRGPAGGFIKPDITAPGAQILAGTTPTPTDVSGGPPGELFQAIAGTSMSSPHIAGSALLLRSLHPDWTPGQVRSAMMTTATTDVTNVDGSAADPFDRGSGRVDLNVAGSVPLTFDETAARYFALGNDPINGVHLNIPSVNAPVMPGQLTTTRTATYIGSGRQQFTVSAASTGGAIDVFPNRFTLRTGESVNLQITITSTQNDVQQFGEITIVGREGAVMHLPVAFIPTQGDVTLIQDCDPDSIAVGATTTCEVTAQNDTFTDATVDLSSTVTRELRILSANGATLQGDAVVVNDAPLAGNHPGVPSVAPGTSPGGFIPLSLFGVTPIPVGDESILNFNVPPYVFAGETFNRLGVTSNGYAVAGGGTGEDVEFDPPGAPNPARPNNVLAPFWTDLDGTGAPGILIAVLTDGVDDWIVVEWQVNVFGSSSNRHFQTWIGVNGTEDITFTYDPAALPADPNGLDFAVGAENKTGTGGQYLLTLPTEDLRVTSTNPTPGASLTYSFVVKGRQVGTGIITSTMVATNQIGTTVVQTPVGVTAPAGTAVATSSRRV